MSQYTYRPNGSSDFSTTTIDARLGEYDIEDAIINRDSESNCIIIDKDAVDIKDLDSALTSLGYIRIS
jgi:hypothetical protein